jgi:hypothetical protein
VNYPLKDFADFANWNTVANPDAKDGIYVRCPNCGAQHAAWFANPIGPSSTSGARVTWQRTGERLETLSLNPSFMAVGHYHSWIRNGQLCVDSPFTCKAKT